MPTPAIHVCIERAIPQAVKSEELAVSLPKKWENGRELHVRFLGGDAAVRRKVQEYAEQWHDYANIRFLFDDHPEAEIRVGFVLDGSSWSALGTDALNVDWFPPGERTMNFGWLTVATADDEFSRTVIHEFGHALGCIHEHSSPGQSIPWNREAVYRYYAARGWTPAVVDLNIFRKYDREQTQYSEFDPESIMLYPIPKELTLNGYEVGWNRTLSRTDKEFIAQVYRRPKAATL